MTRSEILNRLINKFGYKAYLEIGVENPESNFDRIQCERKTGVDPVTLRTDIIPKTSDDFFFKLTSGRPTASLKLYDLIFIDGLHHATQLERDINNALQCLTENGTILVHDVNPSTEEMQMVPRKTTKTWTGDCWKTWVEFRRKRSDLEMFVVDVEYGCGIIRRGNQSCLTIENNHLTYQRFVEHKTEWLNLISTGSFLTWLSFRIWQFVPYSLDGNLGQAYNEYIELVPDDNDWIFLCDSDVMILTPRYLHLMREIIERNPDVGLFTTYTNRVQSKVQIVPDMFEERDIVKHRLTALRLYDEYKYDLKEINQMISGYCMIFKKSVWKEIGGFVTEGMLAVDNDFSSRILKSGRKIMLMKGVYALHYYRMVEGIANKNHLVKAILDMKPDMLVSSRGIAASCDVFPAKIISNTRDFDVADYLNIKNGDTVYVITNALLSFVTHVLPKLEKENITITLVTGAADTSSPREISAIDKLDYLAIFSMSPAVSQWFTQNYDLPSEDSFIHPIPLGLDYHRLAESETQWGPKASPEEQNAQMLEVAAASKPFEERLNRTFSFYGFQMYRHRHKRDRYQANDALKNASYNDVLPHPLNRLDTWKKMSEYKFIISPHGTGLDCYRTYEALALGCIPVVKSSTLDILYKNLPVIILPSWNDISLSLLLNEAEKVRKKSMEKLALQYWVNKIKSGSAMALGGFAIDEKMLHCILQKISPGRTILEFGSGDGTIELLKYYSVISVEDNPRWVGRASRLKTSGNVSHYIYCPLVPIEPTEKFGHSLWYNAEVLIESLEKLNFAFDAVIIDGPMGKHGRSGILPFIARHKHHFSGKTFFIDDCDRNDELLLALELQSALNLNIELFSGKKDFAVLTPKHNVI